MMSNMKIISWNVNGLRALHKKGAFFPIFELHPDILCLQEVKAEAEQLPAEVRNIPGFYSYFDHSKGRKGYSGVALYTKVKPQKVEYGMGNDLLDKEGRLVAAYYNDFVLVNVYFPNGGGGPERLKYKLDFYSAFLSYVGKLKKAGHSVIFCGDINTAHTEIDLARPKENKENTGFLPVERAWIDKVIKNGYVDVFRYLNPEKVGVYTYWDMKTFARERNVGWRIDYFFVSDDFLVRVKKINIHDDIFGSDHCPVLLDIK